jgi:hypothetical protein
VPTKNKRRRGAKGDGAFIVANGSDEPHDSPRHICYNIFHWTIPRHIYYNIFHWIILRQHRNPISDCSNFQVRTSYRPIFLYNASISSPFASLTVIVCRLYFSLEYSRVANDCIVFFQIEFWLVGFVQFGAWCLYCWILCIFLWHWAEDESLLKFLVLIISWCANVACLLGHPKLCFSFSGETFLADIWYWYYVTILQEVSDMLIDFMKFELGKYLPIAHPSC